MRRLFFRENGMISIYLSIILAAVFLFVTVFVDYARIRLAQREADTALIAGMRSVFSAYDRELRTYGLFGEGLTNAERTELLTSEIAANLSGEAASSANITGVFLAADSVQFRSYSTLGNKIIFKDQVLENMKFRAPVEFARHIADKFGKGKKMAQEADEFMQESDELQAHFDRREDLLADAWDEAQRMVARLNQLSAHYEALLAELIALNEQLAGVSRSSLEANLRSLSRIVPQSPEEAQALAAQMAQISITLGKFSRREQLRAQIRAQVETDKNELMEKGNQIFALINQAQDEDQKIAAQAQKWKKEQADTELGGALSIADSLEILGDPYFDKYRSEIGSLQSPFGSFYQMVKSGMADTSPESLLSTNGKCRDLANAWQEMKSAEMKKRAANRNETEKKTKQKETEAEAELEKAKDQSVRHSCGETDKQLYEQLAGHYQHYLAGDDGGGTADERAPDFGNDPKAYGKGAFSFLHALLDIAADFRDAGFVNEYTFSYFNYRTYGLEPASGTPMPGMTDPAKHRLQSQEIEYILNGFAGCEKNYAAVYAEIYSMRFAIRTIEALMDVKKAGTATISPWLIVLQAIVEGAGKAYQDTERLVRGEEVALFVRAPQLKLSYSEYLRLFMLFGSETAKIHRIMALIQLNTGKDLTQFATYAMGKAKTSTPLWFIPGIVKLLGMAGVIDGRVNGKRYEYETAIFYSY